MSMGTCGVCRVPVSRNEDRCEDHLDTPIRPTWATQRFPPWSVIRSDRHPCKVHVVAPADAHRPHMGDPRVQCFCGVGAYSTEKGPKVRIVQPTPELSPGQTWCGTCLGKALEYLGRTQETASLFLRSYAVHANAGSRT